MKQIKWLIRLCLVLIFAGCTAVSLPQQALADFAERPVAFVLIDNDGGVNGAIYKEWRQVVKWAYHFPDYKITDDGTAQQEVAGALRSGAKLNKATLQALAEKSRVDVLVVARVHELDESMVSGFGFRLDHETYVRVVADADLCVYKKDGDKFLQKRVRERGLHEMANYEKPVETIKWQLSKLINTMEGRPIIGS